MPEHSPLGKKLIENARLALAFQRGEYIPPRVKRVPVTTRQATAAAPPLYDATRVQATRQRLALSQAVFAAALNVSPATVRAWERGARVPEGPTRRLLEIAEEQPEILLAKVQTTSAGEEPERGLPTHDPRTSPSLPRG